MGFIGIDPGINGGIAIIDEHGVTCEVMPTTGGEIDGREIINLISGVSEPLAILEKVHSMPKQGVSSTFKFGMGFGKIKGALEAAAIPYVLVTPQAWKKKVLAGLDWKGKKSASVEYCRRRYPDLDLKATKRCRKEHDGMADAICMAEFGRMTYA